MSLLEHFSSSSCTALGILPLSQAALGFSTIMWPLFLYSVSDADLQLVHTRFCGVLLLAPEFSFEIKDSVSEHCFVATNLHFENRFEVKFACSPQLTPTHTLSTLACSTQGALSALL